MASPTDGEIRYTLNRLRGQCGTPPGMSREAVRYVQDERLAKFHEWPSGHWQITEQGGNWLAEHPDA